MSYIVYHKKTSPNRFKRLDKEFPLPNSDDVSRLGLDNTGPDRTVRAVALLAAESIGVQEGEFLVKYTANFNRDEWVALIHVGPPPAPVTTATVL